MANISEHSFVKTSSLLKCSTFSILFVAVLSGIYVNWPPPNLTPELYEWKRNGNYYTFVDKYSLIPYEIFFRDDTGSGEGIVLCLHGFPTSSYDWKKIYDGLKLQFSRIVAPDFIGLGFSQKPITHHIFIPSTNKIVQKEQNYSIFQQADAVEALLSSLNITSVHILSHDYGDTVAQELTFRYTSNQNKKQGNTSQMLQIKSLTLLNGGVIPSAYRPLLIQELLLSPSFSFIFSSFNNYWIFKYSLSRVFGRNTQPSEDDLWDWWVQLRYKEGDLTVGKILQYIPERRANKDRWIRSLQEAKFPIHMIYGKMDPVNPPPFEEMYRNFFPNSNITVLHDTGHYVQWESPLETIKCISSFITHLN